MHGLRPRGPSSSVSERHRHRVSSRCGSVECAPNRERLGTSDRAWPSSTRRNLRDRACSDDERHRGLRAARRGRLDRCARQHSFCPRRRLYPRARPQPHTPDRLRARLDHAARAPERGILPWFSRSVARWAMTPVPSGRQHRTNARGESRREQQRGKQDTSAATIEVRHWIDPPSDQTTCLLSAPFTYGLGKDRTFYCRDHCAEVEGVSGLRGRLGLATIVVGIRRV